MSRNIEAISAMPNNIQATHLLVMLHGWGANYQDFVPFAKMLNFPGLGYLFPNAPFAHFQMPEGRAWYGLETKEFVGLAESRQLLLDWLNSLEDSTGVPLQRTIMAGFSQGGAMTLDVGLSLPLAAICSLSGYLHYQPKSTANYPPALIIHGQQDQIVPLEAAQNARDELTKLGIPLEYHELPMAHEVPNSAVDILKKFITKQINQ